MRVIGLGAGGHSKVVIDMLQVAGTWELVGLLDSNSSLWHTSVLGVPVLGGDNLLSELYTQGITNAFIGVGSIGDTQPRRRLYEKVLQQGFQVVNAIHPQSIIARSVQLGDGVTIMAGCILNADACLGENVVINTGSIIEHDCQIGDHVFIGPGVRLGGTVDIGSGAHVGLGAVVRQNIQIGKEAVIGAGAVVVKDVPDKTLVVGVPARRRIED
jgi:sugar O-acyltransferase (sialic acid O-acetyltransferase NeuD family)